MKTSSRKYQKIKILNTLHKSSRITCLGVLSGHAEDRQGEAAGAKAGGSVSGFFLGCYWLGNLLGISFYIPATPENYG